MVNGPPESSEEEVGVELEETTNQTKKRSSSWRFSAMFTKSQVNLKPDKATLKPSVFPNNGNILKKKARSTILSVLSRRQSQEKLFLDEKPAGNQHSSLSSSEPGSQETKLASQAVIVDLNASKPNPQRPSSVAVRRQSLQLAPSKEVRTSSDSTNKVSQVDSAIGQEKCISSRTVVDSSNVTQTGLDSLDNNGNIGKLGSRWPPPRNPDIKGESLGLRRVSAPKHLFFPPEVEVTKPESDVMVVSMSPSYISVKDITQDTPSSPRFESDSVKVSIPFQVQGQSQQPEKADHGTDPWSSSVSVCVPFQVDENGASVTLLSSAAPALAAVGSSSAVNSLRSAGKDKIDGAVTKATTHSSPQPSPQPSRRKTHKEGQFRDKRATKESPKSMGKEASKHKAMEKAVSSAALKAPTGGKPRSRSFNVGDKVKLTPSPSGTPSSETPKSSPSNSPKPQRRNAMSKDMNKKRPSEIKKQDAHSRPHSDPLIAEKINNKKKSKGDPAVTNTATTGPRKTSSDSLQSLTNKVKDLEIENKTLKDKFQPMEQRLAVVTLLEKEKLHLQKQYNEILQENEKRKSEVELLNVSAQKEKEEREELKARHDKLATDLEKTYEAIKELKHQTLRLEEIKSSLERENDKKVDTITKYCDNIANLKSSNTVLVQQKDEARNKISVLLQGLQSLRDCVTKLKEESRDLQSQVIDKGADFARTMKTCVGGLEKVVFCLQKEKRVTLEEEVQVGTDIADKLDKDTQCSDLQSVELILGQLEGNEKMFEHVKKIMNELESRYATNKEGEENLERELPLAADGIREDGITENQNSECATCKNRQMELAALATELNTVKSSLRTSESERTEAVEESKELKREAKYLKYVLSYREDVQNLQMSTQQSKELEKMSSNLEEAEKKVIDLEDEVGRLQEEKQTLLMSILNLYSGQEIEDVKEEDEEEAGDEMKSEDKDENREGNGEMFARSSSIGGRSPRTPEAVARREELKFRFRLSLSESEYSYTSDRTEGEGESDDEDINSPTAVNLQAVKTENKQLKSNLYEANEEKEELLSNLDKLCEEYDSLKASHDQLAEEHSLVVDRAKKDKIAYQTRLEQIEIQRQNMHDTLRQVQDEKLALLKCLEMKNFEAQPLPSPVPGLDFDRIIARAHALTQEESNEPTSLQNLDLEKIIAHAQSFTQEENKSGGPSLMPNAEMDEIIARAQSFARKENNSNEPGAVPNREMDRIISRAHSFTREENKSSEPTSNEEESDASLFSETEDDTSDQSYNKRIAQRTPDQYVASNGQMTRSTPEDSDLAGIVASIENDLSKLKERLHKRDTSGDDSESRPSKPPPGARILKRQASVVKSNLDRVCREKLHLQNEVESLRRYLLKRRDSAMDLRRKRSRGSLRKDTASELENHLEGIKTLQALLGKSDEQLRQTNEIISRLEAVNNETEEKLRESELLKDDLRRAVQIANNFAMEEQHKAEQLELRNHALLKQIGVLKSGGASPSTNDTSDGLEEMTTLRVKPAFKLRETKTYNRNISEDEYDDNESTFTTEGESDFYSSRRSSINSESDFARSPRDNADTLDSTTTSLNGAELNETQETETECTSHESSTVDTSDDADDDKE